MGYKSDISQANRVQEAVDFPRVVLIDNTSACNLKCSMCDHVNIRKYRKIESMPIDLYHRIIDEIAVENPRARVWEIFFGDPFLCKDIAERIRYAKEKGLTDVVLNSNGVLMTSDKSEAVIASGLDAMYIGVDAATAETYDKIRVGGDFTKAVANILAYRDLLLSVGRPEQQLFVQFVVSEFNEHEVDDFRRFWTENGINVKIRPKISWAGLIKAENLRNNCEVERKPCYWLMQTMNICADGRVTLCSVDLHCRVPCGNVREQTMKELWQHGRLKELRRMHLERRFDELPEMCRNCSDWQSAYAEYILKK